jgi:hypothetical protein
LEIDPIVDFGYLTLTTDGSHLDFVFKTADANGINVRDAITLDLKKGTISNGSTFSAAAKKKPGKPKKPSNPKKKGKKK